MPSRFASARSPNSTSLQQRNATSNEAMRQAVSGLPPVTETFTTAGGAAAGATTTIIGRPCRGFALQVVQTGGVTPWTVLLQGSVDGATWVTLLSHTEADGSGAVLWATDKPVAAVRANVTTITGGTSLAVSYLGVP